MIDLVLFVWAWLATAIAIESMAVQTVARSTPPPRRRLCCNYITKEGEKELEGDSHGEERLCEDAG